MNDMISRAGWTFIQGFLSIFVIADLAPAKVAVIAGVAAALSVVKTYAVEKVSS